MITKEKCQHDIDTLKNYYNSMNKKITLLL